MEMLGLKRTLASRWITEPGLSTGSFSGVALESSEKRGCSVTPPNLSHHRWGHHTHPRPPPTVPTASPFQSPPPVLAFLLSRAAAPPGPPHGAERDHITHQGQS